jgi:GT2 family glycosyltransferase
MIDLSIIVGTLDRPESFGSMYKSIEQNTSNIDWELIVSDAGNKFPVDASLLSNRTKLIIERPRLGFVKGYNKSFRMAQGKYICWLNDDAIVQPNWAQEAIKFMDNNKWVGMGAFYWMNQGGPDYNVEWYQGLPYANFGIIDREFGNCLDWFDEDMTMYGSDNSISFRVFLAGKPVVGMSKARILHRPYTDSYRIDNEKLQAKDAEILMNKYRPFLGQMKKVHEFYKNNYKVV